MPHCGAIVRKVVIQAFTHGGLQMHPVFPSEHNLLHGKKGNGNNLFLGHKSLGMSQEELCCLVFWAKCKHQIWYLVTDVPVFILHLPELLSDITFTSKLESKHILKGFTIIKTSADVVVGSGLFEDYVLTLVYLCTACTSMNFNLTVQG